MGTYSIAEHSQTHPTDTAGKDSADYQTWCYRVTYTPAAGDPPKAFPKGLGDYWLDYTKGKFSPITTGVPPGIAPASWPGSTINDPHPRQTANHVRVQPVPAPVPVVNNTDGSVSADFCFAVKGNKAGKVDLSLHYRDTTFHELVASAAVFGPLTAAATGKKKALLADVARPIGAARRKRTSSRPRRK